MAVSKGWLLIFAVMIPLSSHAIPTIEPIDVTEETISVVVISEDAVIEPVNRLIQTIEAPSRPSNLISPVGDTVIERSSIFSWAEVNGATDYQLWFVNNDDFTFKSWYQVSQDICSGGVCTVSLEASLELGEGYWRLQSKNDTAFSSWSEERHFNIVDFVSGDANGDGSVNIQDVVAIINIVLGSEVTLGADVNGDGNVNIQDVVAAINLILNNN